MKERELLSLTQMLFKQLQKDPRLAKLNSGTEVMNRKLAVESREVGKGTGDGFWFLWGNFVS